MAKKPDGFILYHMDDGASSQLSSLSGLSPFSGPSQGSSNARRAHGARAPPPHTATLRTNFTTGGAGGSDLRRSTHSPGVAHFQTMDTPPANGAVHGNVNPPSTHGAANQFLTALNPQPQHAMASARSMWLVVACIIVGACLGAFIHHFDVDEAVSKWIKLPGDLYVRAVQCIVIPLVFVNLAVSVADIIHNGQGQRIGVRVALLIALTTLICVGEGIGMGYLARAVLNMTSVSVQTSTEAIFGIQCSNGLYLEELASGLVTCTASAVNATSQFVVDDVNDVFVRNEAVVSTGGSLTDNLIVVLKMLVPSNILAAFVSNTLLSIVAFAVPCGITIAQSFHGPIQLNPLLEFLREVNESLILMVNWVIRFTPIAVLSLLAGSFGANLDTIMDKSPIALTLKVCGLFLAAIVVHMFVIMPAIFTAFARSNPLLFARQLVPAYVYSLGCSSSMATLPVSVRCMESSRPGASSILHFVMSIGAALNMHGTAIYLPMMVMFLTDVSGLNSRLGSVEICVLVLASFLASLAAPPVPGGSLTMLATVWSITFPSLAMPSYYAFIVAADVILDRLVTVCNVHGDAMICRIIEDQADAGDLLHRTNPAALRG